MNRLEEELNTSKKNEGLMMLKIRELERNQQSTSGKNKINHMLTEFARANHKLTHPSKCVVDTCRARAVAAQTIV